MYTVWCINLIINWMLTSAPRPEKNTWSNMQFKLAMWTRSWGCELGHFEAREPNETSFAQEIPSSNKQRTIFASGQIKFTMVWYSAVFILSSFTMHAVWAAWLRSAVAFNNWVFICSPDTLSRRRWQGIIFDWRLSELRASDRWLFLLQTLQHKKWPLAEMISHHENDLLPPVLALSPPCLFACLPLLPIRALTSFCPHPPSHSPPQFVPESQVG